MEKYRCSALSERKAIYLSSRIQDQLDWYAKKTKFNRKMSRNFFWALIAVNSIAVLFAILRITHLDQPMWPTDVIVAVAASILSWMQAKRYSELAASYALAAHEIVIIKEQLPQQTTDTAFSLFVGDSENAFSREHTQWVARKDV